MPAQVIRIFSDLHYGERSSRIRDPKGLAPLAEGVDAWIINGDSTDTRQGPNAAHTADVRGKLDQFIRSLGFPVTQLTGNHDPDISSVHRLDLAEGRVFLTHGDILYPEIVPWGMDAERIRSLIETELGAAGVAGRPATLDEKLAVFRRVAAHIPQRHQSERHGGRYLVRLLADLLNPPWRFLRIFDAWRSFPHRAWRLAEEHRLAAQFMLAGHSHWSGIWPRSGAPTIINTGAFTHPFHARIVDLRDDLLVVRKVEERRGHFYPGAPVAELHLKAAAR